MGQLFATSTNKRGKNSDDSSSSSDDSNHGKKASAAPSSSPRRARRPSKNKSDEHDNNDDDDDTTTMEGGKVDDKVEEKTCKVSGNNNNNKNTTSDILANPRTKSTNMTELSPSSSSSSSSSVSLEKKRRTVAAQAEIDRILNGPDPPLDLEREMQKVTSIHIEHKTPPSPSSALLQNDNNYNNLAAFEEELDVQESQLERDLYHAVKRQDYTKAAALKTELGQLHLDDYGSVLAVNSEFYRAFSHKDVQQMEALWLKDETAVCIHPSSQPLLGSHAVLKGWARMFASPQQQQENKSGNSSGNPKKNGDNNNNSRHSRTAADRTWMEPHNIRIAVKGASTAVVTCDEHVFVRRFVRGQRRHTELLNKLTATNIFRKVDGKWYLFYHHSSWHAESEAAKTALRSSSGSGVIVSTPSATSSTVDGLAKARRSIASRRFKSMMENNNRHDDSPSIGMDGILGTSKFGPLLGDGKGGMDNNNKPVKRVFVGSLADLFNGNLADILAASGEDSGSDNAAGTLHVSFSRSEEDEDDDEDDDDDEEEDDMDVIAEDVYEEDDDEEGEQDTTFLKQWSAQKSTALSPSKSSSTASSSPGGVGAVSSPSSSASSSSSPKDTLRQNCITALRKLCEKGLLSQKHKRVLLTDIISCSAKGEFSVVEVAYELLLCGEEDCATEMEGTSKFKDVAEEEFAEQCRVFATSLSEAPPSS